MNPCKFLDHVLNGENERYFLIFALLRGWGGRGSES